ncbi:thiamine pyrophosphate-binding protein [Rhodopila sp.]|jgi:acetolactate synthase-1/2/3 large subunit|uniref:thiamine pyrophosphate-binding protein n=1 Tax=Rhodopila sp. TaxID=2480087 RepID=UPI002CD7218A|nr:thiamine pyrophosphate-binding protein [Rhodopila sp.]HVZ06325.1 thiamine pyrophosphate-binding protein [Rhodopila sp.]
MAIDRMLTEAEPVGDLIGRVLQEAGIEYVFGISGGHTGRIITGLAKYQNSVRMVTVREESLAGVMAEVYGRLTRRPGVLIGQGPWVLGNGLIGTMEAYLSSSPMLLLTDFSDATPFHLHAPYQQATGDYGSWDARRAFGGVTKQVMQAHTPVAAVQATQLAIKHATAGQMGPVTVLFSLASLSGSVEPDSQPVLYPTRYYLPPPPPPADATRVAEATRALLTAVRPVIIAGNGVRISQAYDALEAVAEAIGAPVVTTAAGKGTFAETHPLALGVFGTFGTKAANAAVMDADLVLAIGTKLGPSDTAWENRDLLDPTRQGFIQIDIEPKNASWNFPAEHVLVGDAGTVLAQLREAIGHRAEGRLHHGSERVAALRSEHGYFDGPTYHSDESPLLPQRVIGELMRTLPSDAIVTCDAGENRILMTHFYQTKKAGGFLQAAGSGPMGFAIPAAMGAKLVHPARPCVAICGDGGFAMTMNGLMSAIEQDIPIVVVVFNNNALGWVYHGSGPFAAAFKDFDHGAIARAMGCNGVRVTDPWELKPALEQALTSRIPTVIDVRTSMDVTFADVTSPLAVAANPRSR